MRKKTTTWKNQKHTWAKYKFPDTNKLPILCCSNCSKNPCGVLLYNKKFNLFCKYHSKRMSSPKVRR